MKPSTLIRIASILTVVYCGGHSAGAPWTPTEEPAAKAIIQAMKSHHFDIQGFSRTYWDFYFGFGLIISIFMLVQAVVLWQVGSLAKTDAQRVRPIIASFFVAFVVNAIFAWKYFFAVPVLLATIIAAVLGAAFFAAGPRSSARIEAAQE